MWQLFGNTGLACLLQTPEKMRPEAKSGSKPPSTPKPTQPSTSGSFCKHHSLNVLPFSWTLGSLLHGTESPLAERSLGTGSKPCVKLRITVARAD